jgi:hypothetical protein
MSFIPIQTLFVKVIAIAAI